MAESDNEKRAFFQKGKQKFFISRIRKILNLSNERLARILGISNRTVRDWQREKFSMSMKAVRILCQKIKQPAPRDLKVRDRYWYVLKGASAGGLTVVKKYGRVGGDPEYRKRKWYEWWNKEGKNKYSFLFKNLPFNKPSPSSELAEFFGIMMGDGGMSNAQIRITLHHLDDLEYSKFVAALAEKLFGVAPSIHHRPEDSTNNIVISRSGLVKYFHSLGLPIGNKVKQGFDMPEWVKRTHAYRLSCLRGLMDTDGSLIIHKYKSKGKPYIYKKIGFTSRSSPLLKSVSEILNELNIKHRFGNNFDIRIEAKNDVEEYFNLVGSHNPKHLKRYRI